MRDPVLPRPNASICPGYSEAGVSRTWSCGSTASRTGIPVLAAIGHGGLKEGQVVNKMVEEYEKDHKKEITDEKVLEAVTEDNNKKLHSWPSPRAVLS